MNRKLFDVGITHRTAPLAGGCRTSRGALILAAHGSRAMPSTNRLVRQCSDHFRDLGLFDEVTAAFHRGEPAFAAVLDYLSADEVTVVPLMSSEGYFSQIVLPRELKKNVRYAEQRVHQTRPVGTHPGIVPLVARRVHDRMEEHDLQPGSTTLAIVGHGTGRHQCSRAATIGLADALGRLDLCRQVLPAFLDEDPGVGTIHDRATQANIIVVPFLISRGPHATQDIPEAVGLTVPIANPTVCSRPRQNGCAFVVQHGYASVATRTGMLPTAGRVGGRFIVCDTPVGTDSGIIEIIADLARSKAGVQKECAY